MGLNSSLIARKFGIGAVELERWLGEALSRGGDYADLYFEYVETTSLSLDESIVKSATQGVTLGVGVRVISGEKTGYAYSDDLSAERIMKAARTAACIAAGRRRSSRRGLRKAAEETSTPCLCPRRTRRWRSVWR